jgi:hypothetical protein
VIKCSSIKANGQRCRGIATADSEFCPAHDPTRSEARKKSASEAARSKPNRELAGLKSQLATLYDDVRESRIEPKIGRWLRRLPMFDLGS